MENLKNLKQNELFARLIEYRIDFAYTRQVYFNAFLRVNKQNKKIESRHKLFGFLSILISIITLSALTFYLSQAIKSNNIIFIVSGLSIISLAISIYLFSIKGPVNSNLFLERAEAYLILHKKAKNFEAICQADSKITNEKVHEKLLYFENEQEKLIKLPLEIIEKDYALAKEQIRNRKNYGYDEVDENNT